MDITESQQIETVKSYWHRCDNFGDAITPYLIEKITNKKAEHVPANSNPPAIMITGSILGCSIYRGIVWGTGSAFKSDLNPNCFASPSKDFQIIATRGALSKQLVEEVGHTPITYGDPGILLPRFYTPNVSKKYDVGIMCSWVDYDDVYAKYNNEKITIINSMDTVESIIDRMCECNVIVSSILHGLITAIAYNIPAVAVKFSDKMMGDGFKYRDFLTCTDSQYDLIDLRNNVLNMNDLVSLTFIHKLSINTDDLMNCCPLLK